MKTYVFLPLLLLSFSASAKIFINIGSAGIKKSSLAILPFLPQENFPENPGLKKELEGLIERNIKFSSYFQILSQQAYIEDPKTISPIPFPIDLQGFRWNNWKLSGADFLLFNRYALVDKDLLLTSFFYNVNSQKTLFKKTYKLPRKQARQLINRLSNQIVKSLSGKQGIFETKIVSVRNTAKNKKEIFLMDWQGDNQKRLTYHRSISLSPFWSPRGDKILYTAFVYNKKHARRQAVLFSYSRKDHNIRVVSDKRGANLGASFFPDGKSLLLTLNVGKSLMDIFKFNIRTRRLSPLTLGPSGAIHVEPSVHKKTKQIAFSSNKNGKVHIYTMNPRGGNKKQITFAGHYNSTPSWSPDRNQLVFSGKSRGRFDIFMIHGTGSGLKRLTRLKRANGTWANSESPSFSPDGRFIVFTSDVSGSYQLYIMNLDNSSIERITFDKYNYKSPRWSPYLKN